MAKSRVREIVVDKPVFRLADPNNPVRYKTSPGATPSPDEIPPQMTPGQAVDVHSKYSDNMTDDKDVDEAERVLMMLRRQRMMESGGAVPAQIIDAFGKPMIPIDPADEMKLKMLKLIIDRDEQPEVELPKK